MESIGFTILIVGSAVGLGFLTSKLRSAGIVPKGATPGLDESQVSLVKKVGITGIVAYTLAVLSALAALVAVLTLIASFLPLLITGQFEVIKNQGVLAANIAEVASMVSWASFAAGVIAHVTTLVMLGSKPQVES